MANIEHSAISDPDIHEPKGISSASAGEIYVADGAASGNWSPVTDIYQCKLDNVSAVETTYVPIAFAGTVVRVTTVLGDAISTGDATVTAKNSAGSTMATLTIANSGSAAGDVDTATPSTNNTVTDNDYITLESDGGSTNTAELHFIVVVERSS